MRTVEETLVLFPNLIPLDERIAQKNSVGMWLRQAHKQAAKSNDPSTHVGAVIVPMAADADSATQAHNHILSLDRHPERAQAPAKYPYIVHAEEGAVSNAAKYGIRTDGATMYAPWFSCTDCAKHIGAAGITRVVGHMPMFQHTPDDWIEAIQRAHEILSDDYGVQLYVYTESFGISTLMRGKLIEV